MRLETIKTDEDKTIAGSDYINANLIKSSLDSYYKYVAAQGPTRDTVADFIRMLVQYNIKIVICACNEYEGQKVTNDELICKRVNVESKLRRENVIKY